VWEYIRKARREIATEEMLLQADNRPGPAERAQWKEIFELFMKQCYELLEQDEQILFEDLVIHGVSAAEVGARLDIGANAVNVRKFRIRKWLRDCLAARTGIEDPFV
jgi:RNA polymerase sigma factor (sigma-70 family)